MAAHALELDDGSKHATYHPGASIVTMSLALGEAEGISGRGLVEAIAAGYEVSLRIGTAINPGHYLRGFHPTGTIAVFGTTAAAAKILGLSAEETVNAFGLAGSLASGINQYEIDGAISKHLHPGNAARNGILSAMLARDGMTGPAEILEGRLGFFHCFAETPDLELVTANLGSDWHFLRIYFKPFCSCRYVHYAIEATRKDLEQHPFPPEEIESIVVRTHRNAKQGSDIPDYRTPLHARLSIQYGIASILVRGRAGLKEYEEEAIRDPEVRRISDRVRIEIDEEIQKLYPNPRSMIVEIQDRKGNSASSRIDHAKGDPENPMTEAEILEKFRDVTTDVIQPEMAERIIAAAKTIESREEIASFAKLLQI
jgi:2-methylcitrate dehydratase PrpD